jgi:hypothetical protein
MMEEKNETVVMTAEELKAYEAYKANKSKKDAEEKRKNDRDTYRQMVNDEVLKAIPTLLELSKRLEEAKKKVFSDFQTVLEMKSDVMKLTKDNQKSHTFTDARGKYRIELGTYQLDGYDDTLEDGVEMVKEYIMSLADNEKTKSLVSMVLKLLAKDATGNLKASRVLQLRKLANESGDERFVEGVRIIEESYRPVPSKTFLRASQRDERSNEWKPIPLGMTES